MRRTSGKEKEKTGRVEAGSLKIHREDRRVYIENEEINLTTKEYDLLELLVINQNRV
jgi:DNA-binding response OmpR family regulator